MAWTRKDFLKNAAAVGAALATGLRIGRRDEAQAAPLRPPGALEEDDFLSTCIRCGRCGDACPNQCIQAFTKENGSLFSMAPGSGEVGTPVIFPRQQACNLCQRAQGDELLCTVACPTGALQPVTKSAAAIQKKVTMGKAVVDTNLCYSYTGNSCGVCVRACPFEGKALRAGQMETPIIDPDFCVGCGLCERACIRYPQAITVVT
jgi:ferredoxin-type protein NapG